MPAVGRLWPSDSDDEEFNSIEDLNKGDHEDGDKQRVGVGRKLLVACLLNRQLSLVWW